MILSPKHLSFDEMWKLYKTIEPSLPNVEKEHLVDEVIEILKKITQKDFISSLHFMYGKGVEKGKNPAEFGLLFIKGIKENKLFSFVEFIKRLQT